jgi:CheY-like chemotaxis protein
MEKDETKRVLVCDDDQDILYMVTFVLKEVGWEIYSSGDCKNIIDKVREIEPSVILMDVNFPKANVATITTHLNGFPDLAGAKGTPFFKDNQDERGAKMAKAIKNHLETRHIPVILFSSSSEIDILAEESGTNYYLQKPFEIKDLQDIVSRAYVDFKANQVNNDK